MTAANSRGLAQKALWGGYSRTGNPSAVHDCYYQCANNDPKIPQLWGYMDDLSYASGSIAQLAAYQHNSHDFRHPDLPGWREAASGIPGTRSWRTTGQPVAMTEQ